jgi:hypothetical protein
MIQYIFNDLLFTQTFQQFRDQEDVAKAVVNLFDLAMGLLVKGGARTLRNVE